MLLMHITWNLTDLHCELPLKIAVVRSFSPFAIIMKKVYWLNFANIFIWNTDYFLKTTTSGRLWMILSEKMTEQYQCMTFWYKFNYCDGMSFNSTQELDYGNTMSHNLSDVQGTNQWLFAEMPLERRYIKSKVFDKAWILNLM